MSNARSDGNESPASPQQASQFVSLETKPHSADSTSIELAGRYKLISVIGEGGMGTVWLAEQKEPVKRNVAIKLVKAGMDSRAVLARFDAERQALAMMDHTNISRVFDGGVSERGHPFFVMELVKGIPITDYCDQNRMELSGRLALFNQVCSAVQHAHQKGVIHRDLKPSNILVTENDGKPVCKVIDFGLAKALHGSHTLTDLTVHTEFGAVIGTPLYMSPEQFGTSALDVDTRSDLFSLGVILYELLTGSTPLERVRLKQAALDEIGRIVRDEEPPIPSQRLSASESLPSVAACRQVEPTRLTRDIRGDLDWIVMKALEKDRNRRYETAIGLSTDIQRHLAGEPVLAAPPSRVYRIRKFIHKYRKPVAAAAALLVSLVGGVVGTTLGMYSAIRATESEKHARADAELQRSEAITQKARVEIREQEAINAVRRFGDAVSQNPELKNNPALESLRKELLKEPLAFFQSLRMRLESDAATTTESLANLAIAASDLGTLTSEIDDKQNAMLAFEQSIAIWDRMIKLDPTNVKVLSGLASAYNSLGVLQKATTGMQELSLQTYNKALTIRQQLVRNDSENAEFQKQLARTYYNIGVLLRESPKLAEAEMNLELGRQIQEQLCQTYPNDDIFQSDLASTYNSLGILLSKTRGTSPAIEAYQKGLAIQQRLVLEHPSVTEYQGDLARSHYNMGNVLETMNGHQEESLESYQKSLEVRERLARDFPSSIKIQSELASVYNAIGNLLSNNGNRAESARAYEQSLAIHERLARENPKVIEYQNAVAISHNNIGNLLKEKNKLVEALKEYELALAIRQQLALDNPSTTYIQIDLAKTYHNIGNMLSDMSKPQEALAAHERSLEIRERLAEKNPTNRGYKCDLARTFINIGIQFKTLGDQKSAMQQYEKGICILEQIASESPTTKKYRSELADGYASLGMLHRLKGELKKSKDLHEKARDILESLVEENPTFTEYQSSLAARYNSIGIILSAEDKLSESLIAHQKALGFRKKLAEENSKVVAYQIDLAASYSSIGGLYSLLETDKPEEALNSLQNALVIRERLCLENPTDIDLKYQLAKVQNDIGLLFLNTRKFDEALNSFEKAFAIREQLANDHPLNLNYQSDVGGILNNIALIDLSSQKFTEARDRLLRAIEFQRRALEGDSKNSQFRKFLNKHYASLFKAATSLRDSDLVASCQVELRKLAMEAPGAAELESRMKAVADGAPAENGAELRKLGKYAYDTYRFSSAARLYADALKSPQPNTRTEQLLYSAACSAALAADGKSIDDATLGTFEVERLRGQSLVWLQESLAICRTLLEKATDQERSSITRFLRNWQEDLDLVSVREAEYLSKLPSAERESSEALWKEVSELISIEFKGDVSKSSNQ